MSRSFAFIVIALAVCIGTAKSEPAAGEATAPKVGESFRDCADCPELVVVPAGSFMMGSPEDEPKRRSDEGPQHRVTIAQPFAVGKFAVTFAEFMKFVTDADYKMDDCFGQQTARSPVSGRGGDHAAVCVHWEDAQAYVTWLSRKTGKNYRLPSEAEREYFARAGTTAAFWWGPWHDPDQVNPESREGDLRRETAPVSSFGPNPWGLHQVQGNVWEWTQDCWRGNYAGAPNDGSAWTSGDCAFHVVRGGSWNARRWVLRSAVRMVWKTDVMTGLRVARALEPQQRHDP